jgi:hypothetical protein
VNSGDSSSDVSERTIKIIEELATVPFTYAELGRLVYEDSDLPDAVLSKRVRALMRLPRFEAFKILRGVIIEQQEATSITKPPLFVAHIESEPVSDPNSPSTPPLYIPRAKKEKNPTKDNSVSRPEAIESSPQSRKGRRSNAPRKQVFKHRAYEESDGEDEVEKKRVDSKFVAYQKQLKRVIDFIEDVFKDSENIYETALSVPEALAPSYDAAKEARLIDKEHTLEAGVNLAELTALFVWQTKSIQGFLREAKTRKTAYEIIKDEIEYRKQQKHSAAA